MRSWLAGCCVVVALAAAGVAAATTPMTLLLATAHGRNSVTISTPTAHLHGRVWLYRHGGVGVAHGRATISCRTKQTAAGVGGVDQWFRLTIKPNAKQNVWQYGGDACTIDISLTGHGALNVTLSGY